MKNLTKPVGDLYPHMKKLTLIMRLSVLLILIAVFTSTASVYSQATKLTIKMENARLSEVFDAIEKQSEFYFFYNRDYFNDDRIVSVDVENKLLDEVLKELLKDEAITWEIFDRNILLTIPDTPLTTAQMEVMQQQKSVSGKVTDETGQPLPGVTVVVKGTTQGTVTNSDGNYSITNIPENATLVFSFVGMRTQEVVVGNQTAISITMEVDAIGIEEVVAIGYGTQKKINVTGAISTVDEEKFEGRPVVFAEQALQGHVPNLNISIEDGGPGKSSILNIRGYSGLGAFSEPLILIDGIIGSLRNINPQDIESMTVLKDASSAAIYGAKAAYGVILITTKMGKKNQETPMFTYSSNFSLTEPTVLPQTAGSLPFALLLREASMNDGGGGVIDLETIDRIEQYYNDPTSIPNNVVKQSNPRDWADWNDGRSNANVDWFDLFFKRGSLQKHNLSFRGGSKSSSYYTSIGYTKHQGNVEFFDDYYDRINVLAKINTDATNWLNIGFTSRFDFQTINTVTLWTGQNDAMNTYISNHVAAIWPTMPAIEPNGHYATGPGLNALTQTKPDNTKITNFWQSGYLLFKLTPGLTANLDLTYHNKGRKQTYSTAPRYAYRADNNELYLRKNPPEVTQVWHESGNEHYLSSNAYATFEYEFGEHAFKIMGGTQLEYAKTFDLYATKKHLLDYNNPSISTAIGLLEGTDALDHWSILSYFGRLNYNFKEKYLFEFNLRTDGSSRYPDKSVTDEVSQWGIFPSVSAGWNLAKESFFSSLNQYLSEFKIRGSWGQLGNMRGKPYQYLRTISYNPTDSYIMGGNLISSFGTPSILSFNTWETNQTLNFGIDITSLNNRLSTSFDWFQKDIIDLITKGVAVSAVLGAKSPESNNADIRTVGWELDLKWKSRFNLFEKPLIYDVFINISDYQGKVIKYSNPEGLLSDWYEGKMMGEIWGLTTDYIMVDAEEAAEIETTGFQEFIDRRWSQGDIKYKDINNDGVIDYGNNTLDDPGDLSVIGNNTPRFNFGFGFNANWNSFDISGFFQGTAKRDVWLAGNSSAGVIMHGLGYGQYRANVWKNMIDDVWRNDGNNMDPYWPKMYLKNRKNLRTQTKYLDNAAYLRLKNIQIGYTIPLEITRLGKLERARIYFSGDNLFTFSRINENFDPESSGGGSYKYPLNKAYSFGINISF